MSMGENGSSLTGMTTQITDKLYYYNMRQATCLKDEVLKFQ